MPDTGVLNSLLSPNGHLILKQYSVLLHNSTNNYICQFISENKNLAFCDVVTELIGRMIYNKNNTISKDWIVADELADERLGTSYYQIVVKAYRSNSSGQETPGSDELLGTSTMNLHVRMTKANIVLDWLDSYFWDEYFIDNDLDKIYLTAEDLIAEYLGEYISTT